MSRENILKHLRPPEGVDEDDWKKTLRRHLEEYDQLRVIALCHKHYGEIGQIAFSQPIDSLCDRCEALEQENARLKAMNDRYHEFILGLRVLIENGDTAHNFSHSALHLMLCNILEPQEPSE
jgi:hypothetical protein